MTIQTVKFHCFQCKETEENDITTNYLLPQTKIEVEKYKFFNRNFNESIWLYDIEQIIFLTKKGIKQLEQASIKTDLSNTTTNYLEIRENIVNMWLCAKEAILNNMEIPQFENMAATMNDINGNLTKLSEIPDYVFFNQIKGEKGASYNFIHLWLDLKWITLDLNYKRNGAAMLETAILEIMTDLIYIGGKKFERGSFEAKPFLCQCFKEFWLLLQLLVEKGGFRGFWSLFNQTVKEVLKEKSSCVQIWLLYHLAQLHGYDEKGNFLGEKNNSRIVSNYELVEECLKNILQSTCDEKTLRICLELVLSFQTKWWTNGGNFGLQQLLFEHFFKRIQTSFAIKSDSTSTFILPNQNFINFDEVVQNLLENNPISCTSYEIFLCSISFFLKKNPSHWSKFKGRIYSKLSISKLATYNEVGLQNLITLLLVLANSISFDELSNKLMAFLDQMPKGRREDSCVIWSAYMSLILVFIKRDVPILSAASVVVNLVESVSTNRNKANLMKLFVDWLDLVINERDLQCGQYVLFASNWIKNYLQWCPMNEACILLELITRLIKNLKYQECSREWSSTIDSYIVPALVNLAMGTDSPSIVAKLAATIVSLDSQKYKQLVEQFTGDSINIENVEKFLRYLFENADIHQLVPYQTSLIQAWIKINMFSQTDHYLTDITLQVSKFPEWVKSFGSFEISESEDILYLVIKLAGGRIREAKNISEVAMMKRWFETYFGNMDNWVRNILNSNEKSDNNKILIRVYTYGALLFIHCCSALYTKNKTSSLLHRLISTMLLPTSILTNKKPPENLLAALKITWHLFIRGLVQLDYNNDPYIERILKDIVIRYIPHLHDSNSPIIRCMDHEFKDKDTLFIIDKICTLITYRSRIVNEYAQQALNLILEMFFSRKDVINKLKILVEKSFPSILELIMFVDNVTYKKLITNIFYAVVNHQRFVDLKESVDKSIVIIIDKHLPFYSSSVFQMLELLVKIMKSEISEVLPQLKGAIEKVERMRGVGYDNTLRKGLQDIQELSKKL